MNNAVWAGGGSSSILLGSGVYRALCIVMVYNYTLTGFAEALSQFVVLAVVHVYA